MLTPVRGAALFLALASLLAVSSLPAQPASHEDEAPEPEAPLVVRLRLASIIHAGAADFVTGAIRQAEERGAELLVIELDTPGGILSSTREIFSAMLGSRVPIAVYVAPSGAQAASAGFFLLMAADVAAMAPGTNTGAAHPVGAGGEDIRGVLGEKVEQDAAATIRSLAARNGRNVELAEAAVVESRSFTAQEALEEKLIDLVVADLPALVELVDGREVRDEGEERRVLQTTGARIESVEMTPFQKFLSTIAHPNIAYILMTLGVLGLYFELQNPGAVLPGVVGAICLILAFFALSVLPVNYAGVALILLAIVFFVAEIKVTSFGLLAVAGIVSLVLGSLLLFRSADPAIRVSLDVVVATAAFALVVVAFMTLMSIRAHRRQVRTGAEGLVHERGVARTELAPRGRVFVHGEIWDAVAEGSVGAGEPVEVVAVEGLTLRVRPATERSPSRTEEVI